MDRTLAVVLLSLASLAAATLPPPAAADDHLVDVTFLVLDDAGAPVARAELVLRPLDADLHASNATTDAAGRAALTLAPVEHRLEVFAPGHLRHSEAYTPDGTEHTVRLAVAPSLARHTLTVLVQDADGEPLGGADVVARSRGEEVLVRSDPDGLARLDLPSGDVVVFAAKTGYARSEQKLVLEGDEEIRLTLRARETAGDVRVDVTVRDRDGRPVPDAGVTGNAWSEDGHSTHDRAVTDRDGRATLLLQGEHGHVQVEHREHHPGYADLPLHGEDSVAIDIVLEPKPKPDARVTGTVRDEQGAPIPGARVVLRPDYRYSYLHEVDAPPGEDASGSDGSGGVTTAASVVEPSPPTERPPDDARTDEAVARPGIWYCCPEDVVVTTDRDGRYEAEVVSGDLWIEVSAKGFATQSERTSVRQGTTREIDVTLAKIPPRDAVLRGTVVDATGRPLAGAGVSLSNFAWGDHGYATTDSLGRFEIRTYPGYSQVHVYPGYDGGVQTDEPVALVAEDAASSTLRLAPQTQYYTYVGQLDLRSGSNELDVRLEPKPEPSVVLVGYALDRDGKRGIPGAWVNIRNEDTGEWGHAQTDKDGSFKLFVRPGRMVLDVSAEGYYARSETFVAGTDALQRRDVELQKGQTRWIPWEEREDHDGVRPMEERAVAGYAEKGAPSAPPTAFATSDGAAADERLSSSGGQTYRGEGGGLGPYRPQDLEGTTVQRDAPGAALALGVLAIAGAALVAARRTRTR